MIRKRLFLTMLVVTLIAGALIPPTHQPAHAQSNITLQLNVPFLWEDILTPELMAEFEAQNPGVTVEIKYSDAMFFGFGPNTANTTVDDRLDDTEELVTSADVLYVDSSSLTAEDTQAGYFLNLSPLVMNDSSLDTSDFIPSVWHSYQWDNGIWALPLSTDVILLTYDPVSFDNAGLAYPNERWTIDDFANAARALTQYNADGTVANPGFSTVSGGNNLDIFLRALAGASFYDAATMPNAPSFSNPALEHVLQVWYELVQEGVVAAQGGAFQDVPLRVEGINGYAERPFNPEGEEAQTVHYATLLPGNVAGLSVQGFAISAGTQYPEQAYALAKFLTSRSELASNMFSASPARYSLVSTVEQTSAQNNGGPGDPEGGPTIGIAVGGPGGGGAVFIMGGGTVPEVIKPTFDQGLNVGLPVSELRYTSYLSNALAEMSSNGGDAQNALQTAEALAITDTQTAQSRNGTVALYVIPPEPEPTLAAGEIELTCGVNMGFGRVPGGEFPNQDQWDQVIADFVASDPEVGIVTLEAVQGNDLAALAEQYDCIILPSNVVADTDLSTILSLDPLLSNDATFDPNDIIGNTLVQLQQDNKTWGLPLAIEPQMLEYDSAQFAQAGVPEPINGWTTDAFVDALKMLKPNDTDPAPFQPNDPTGAAMLMIFAAFGALPMDYRTDPPTINFTDPATVDGIRQILDLVLAGYIDYSSGEISIELSPETIPAITTSALNMFRRIGPPGAEGSMQDTTVTTTYPQGSQYSVISYSITTGYISASAQNPEAAYRFLSQIARNPQLFSGMPVRQSFLSDPAVMASQGEEIVAVYQQLDALLRSPNTIVFPAISGGGGMAAINFMQEYWLRQALENYLENGADLETGLADAELLTKAYMECTASIVVDTTSGDADEQRQQYAEQVLACATSVDPSFSIGIGGD